METQHDTTRRRRWLIPAVAALVAALAWVAFGWFGVHKLVVDDEVDDAPPAFASGSTAVALAEGSFVPRSHPTTGRAVVLGDGTGQRFLRLEPFETDNGPDLDVYLSTAPPDAAAERFTDDLVNLGDLRGNVGSQNYEIPADVDLSRYRTVVIWCVRFGVAFGVAELLPRSG